jgi:hypothetical protein
MDLPTKGFAAAKGNPLSPLLIQGNPEGKVWRAQKSSKNIDE